MSGNETKQRNGTGNTLRTAGLGFGFDRPKNVIHIVDLVSRHLY
jgi:hypothetical protein